MLNNLRIKNFRMLEDLQIARLGRVNLIVGRNNCGKSSVLEGLRLYAGGGNPSLLSDILTDHDELLNFERTLSSGVLRQNWTGLKYLFPNREFPVNEEKSIVISSDKNQLLKIEHVFYYIEEATENNKNINTQNIIRRRIVTNNIDSAINDNFELKPAIRITSQSGGSELIDLIDCKESYRPSVSMRMSEFINYSLVSTHFLSNDALAKLWDKVTLSPYEDIVLKALNIIEDTIERLAFINSENSRIPIVKLKNSDTPIPLNSMGDAMSRILQLILSVFPAENGILLIDEFENGLHYSIQEKVWRMIFQLATDLNIQVFATTHSWDCIESFTKAAVNSPEDGVLLKLSRSRLTSDNGKIIATVYDESELQTITASELEVR